MKINPQDSPLCLYADRTEDLKKNLDRILSALGLAMNAGGLAVGSEAVSQALSNGKARLVFLPFDLSDNTEDRLLSRILSADTRFILLPCTKAVLAERLGKTGFTSAACLVRPGFEKILFNYMDPTTVKKHQHTTEVH